MPETLLLVLEKLLLRLRDDVLPQHPLRALFFLKGALLLFFLFCLSLTYALYTVYLLMLPAWGASLAVCGTLLLLVLLCLGIASAASRPRKRRRREERLVSLNDVVKSFLDGFFRR